MGLWVIAALGSALFAGITSVLAKAGIRRCDSDVATAIRTTVVLVLAWAVAAVAVPDLGATLATITPRSYLFLALSGLATGGSWVCYFKALACGDINKVVPIDKSSSALSALLAIMLFGETGHLAQRLACIALILAGTYLMVERREAAASATRGGGWLAYAVASAVFAALTSVLAKVGVEGVDSNLATALRTGVVLALAWVIVAARGKLGLVHEVGVRELGFLVASGIATGASWLCYYYAIQAGEVSVVVQLDRLSVLVSVAAGRLAFGERLSRRALAGLSLITVFSLMMVGL